jgi:hypothetical protein
MRKLLKRSELEKLITEEVEKQPFDLQGMIWKKVIHVSATADGPNWRAVYSAVQGSSGHAAALDRVIPKLQALYDLDEPLAA